MMKRIVYPLEHSDNVNCCMIQLGMRISDKSVLESSVENLIKWVPAFHITTDDKFYYRNEDPTPVYRIPKFKTMDEHLLYMAENHTRPFNEALASIGCNDEYLVMNIMHGAADGGYFLFLFDSLKRGSVSCEIPKFFAARDVIFRDDIREMELLSGGTCRLMPKDRRQLGFFQKIRTVNEVTQIEDLKCYDKNKKKCVGLTDSFWSSMILACSAYNGNFDNKGVFTCLDSRPFANKNDLTTANMFSMLNVFAENINYDSSVSDLQKALRKNFEFQYRNKHNLGILYSWLNPSNRFNSVGKESKEIDHTKGANIEISKMGSFHLEGCFEDVGMSIHLGTQTPEVMGYLAYGVTGKGKNILVSKNRYTPSNLSHNDMQIYTKSVLYALENIDTHISCGKAIEKLQEYQENLLRTIPKPYAKLI